MLEYYDQRASEYDKVYQKPERQKNLRELESIHETIFKGLNILEIACGTGYWTQFIAKSAHSILATDYNSEVIKIAKSRNYYECKISFMQSDAYSLENINGSFSGGYCGFWWSHIPRSRTEEFLYKFHSKLLPGSKVVMIDNRYVEGSSTPISRTSDTGDTYQLRKLEDGSEHEVLKNFPSEEELIETFKGTSFEFKVVLLDYFWLITYKTK